MINMFGFDVFAAMDILFFFVFPIVFLGIFILVAVIRYKYKKFVLNHSIGLKELKNINSYYRFKDIPNFDLEHSYDNEHFYENISCKDYLIYELVYLRFKVAEAANDTLDNAALFKKYENEIAEKCLFNKFDVENNLKLKELLEKTEKRIFEKEILRPVINFSINVKLIRTNINGYYRESKEQEFFVEDIRDIVVRLKNKTNNGYYKDRDIWDSICRVERGKVTNKMRFSIYNRDHYRCCKCHRRTDDLEIDHIIPISKGGKSTYDNLQTLCHRCNVEKGSYIEEDY